MFEFTESRLRFVFESPWEAVQQWDKLHAFTHGLGRVSTTGAVDFVGLFGSEPYFIEVKNFRDHRIENKRRLASGELVAEIADKVRDTIAGLVWAMGRGHDDAHVRSVVAHALRSKCHVVLWLEEDLQTRPVDRSVLAQGIKRRLHWFQPRVLVLSSNDRPLPGLGVRLAAREEA